jgi:hypothetical protein
MPLDNASLASARLAIHRQSKDDIVYARANGRAIWLPREFSKPHPADRKSAAPAPAARSGGRLCAGQARNVDAQIKAANWRASVASITN